MLSQKSLPFQPGLPARSVVGQQVLAEAPKQFIARNARVKSSITMTVAGTLADGDQMKVEVVMPGLPGGKISKTVALTSGETATTAAQKIAKALNDDDVLRSYGCFANSALGVVTFYWPGPVGNQVTVTRTILVGVGTLTLGNSGKLSGGSGPVIPFETFNFQSGGQLHRFERGVPKLVGDNVIREMVASGASIL